MTTQKFFTFPIDHETKAALRRLALAQDRSRAAVLRQLVKDAALQCDFKRAKFQKVGADAPG